jgi:hypothetical protein
MHSSNPIGTDISASIERSRLSVSIAENRPTTFPEPPSLEMRIGDFALIESQLGETHLFESTLISLASLNRDSS